MNIGTIACLIFADLFAAVAGVFALLGPKGALLVSGFQSMPKERRQTYDMDKLSRDQRRALLLWAALWLSGALLCQLAGHFFFDSEEQALWLSVIKSSGNY